MVDLVYDDDPAPQPAGNIVYDDDPSMSAGEVALGAIQNFPESAAEFGRGIYQTFRHPVETAKSVGELAKGVVQLAVPGEQGSEETARAVGDFFKERYGGLENIKRTIATDPVGFAADLSTVLTGGGLAAARAPGVAGQLARSAQAAGRAVDPLAVAGRGAAAVARPVGQGAADIVGALGTHTGGEAIRTAARAGFEGGERGRAFREAMRGQTQPRVAVDEARDAVTRMKIDRGNFYRQHMDEIGKSAERVDFDEVLGVRDQAINDFSRGGRMPKKVGRVRQQVDQLLDEWAMDPEAHTPVGMDTLKQDLWDIQSKFATKRDSRYNYVNRIRQGVADEIKKQAPEYQKVMKGYQDASEQIQELERTLSLNPQATIDTALRKLMTTVRNNANTNYGRRVSLLDMLEEAGASNLNERISGMAMQSVAPQGIGRLVGGATALGAGGAIASQGAAVMANPFILGGLAVQSPRAVGEAVHLAGRGAGALAPVASRIPQGTGLAAFQAGRIAEEDPRRRLAEMLR